MSKLHKIIISNLNENKMNQNKGVNKTYLNFQLHMVVSVFLLQLLYKCDLVIEIWVVRLLMSLLVIYYLDFNVGGRERERE